MVHSQCFTNLRAHIFHSESHLLWSFRISVSKNNQCPSPAAAKAVGESKEPDPSQPSLLWDAVVIPVGFCPV